MTIFLLGFRPRVYRDEHMAYSARYGKAILKDHATAQQEDDEEVGGRTDEQVRVEAVQ